MCPHVVLSIHLQPTGFCFGQILSSQLLCEEMTWCKQGQRATHLALSIKSSNTTSLLLGKDEGRVRPLPHLCFCPHWKLLVLGGYGEPRQMFWIISLGFPDFLSCISVWKLTQHWLDGDDGNN